MPIPTAVLQNNIGASLRRWRVLNRVKQQALARDLGVSQSRVSRWESGSAQPEGQARTKILRLLEAQPATAADRALLDLVAKSAHPVHLVCDLSHRLLALSPAREREWHIPASDFMNRPLWRFATDGIRTMEGRLGEHGWFEPFGPDICFATERAEFPEMFIPESRIRITRLPLSDGSFARLVREDA